MMDVWVRAQPWDKELATAALEEGAAALIVDREDIPKARELGVIKTISEGGDLSWGRDVVRREIRSGDDIEGIISLAADKRVIAATTDWRIIPLENLVARSENIYIEVSDVDQARIAAGVLEKGASGIVITGEDEACVRNILRECRQRFDPVALHAFEVREVRPVGAGHRVCIDTCTLMKTGQGCLIGNSSRAMFLMHAENIEGPYVSTRPFRINAGGVHSYVMTPGGRTRYLSELRAGDDILIIDHLGNTSAAVVGRTKIEIRPLLLIKAASPTGLATALCQNAETIRFVGENGEAFSVAALKPGLKILGFAEEMGRHLGYSVQETILEQ